MLELDALSSISSSGEIAFSLAYGQHCLERSPLGEKNGSAAAYLSSAAFVVGRRSLFDRRMLRFAPSTWELTFWRLLEGELAGALSFALRLRSPPRRISGLELREAGGDWAGLGEADGGRKTPSAALDEPCCNRWSSLATLGELGCKSCRPLAALGV